MWQMGRQLPVPVGLTQQRGKLEFDALAAKPPMPLPLGEVPPKGA